MASKYYVSTAVCHLAAASESPHQQAMMGALLKDENIAGTLLNVSTNGFAKYAHQFFTYAKSIYTLKLPSGYAPGGAALNTAAISDRINQELGGGRYIVVDSGQYTLMSPLIAMLSYLYSVRQYNSLSEIIGTPPSNINWEYPLALVGDTYIQLPVPTRVELYRVERNPDGVTATITYSLYKEEYIIEYQMQREGYAYGVPVPVMSFYKYHSETVAIPNAASILWDTPCLVVSYREQNGAGVVIKNATPWVYQINTGLYPELNRSANIITPDEYFPVVPIRYNNTDLVTPKSGELYTTSKALLNVLKIDIHQLADKLNANPSLKDIDHAYVMFGIDLQTKHEGCLRYLHKFFDQLWALAVVDESDFLTNIGGTPQYGMTPLNEFPIRYRNSTDDINFTEYGLNLTVSFDYISSEYLPGTIGNGNIRNVRKEFSTYTVQINTGRYTYDETGYDPPVPIILNQKRGIVYFYKQVAPGVVHKIGVYNLAVTNLIYPRRDKAVVTNLLEVINDDDEHNLVIPVQYNLIMSMHADDRNAILAESFILVINSIVKVSTKWYESKWFRFVLVVAAIVITIYTGQAWVLQLVAALNTSFMAAAIFIAMSIGVSLAVNYAVNWLVDIFGPKLGIIGSAILAIVAVIVTGGRSLIGMTKEFAMMLTQHIMQVSMALISAANEFLLEQSQEIINEYRDFSNKLEDRYAELKTAQDLLEDHADIDPLIFTRPARNRIILNEYPSAFYTRCLGLVNNSMYPIHDEIPSFITAKLTLPSQMSIATLYSFDV